MASSEMSGAIFTPICSGSFNSQSLLNDTMSRNHVKNFHHLVILDTLIEYIKSVYVKSVYVYIYIYTYTVFFEWNKYFWRRNVRIPFFYPMAYNHTKVSSAYSITWRRICPLWSLVVIVWTSSRVYIFNSVYIQQCCDHKGFEHLNKA